MKKKQIKELAQKSYTKSKLDERKVEEIANSLRRKDLKKYIKRLKNWEQQKTVLITIPKPLHDPERKKIEQIFPDKSIVYKIDPSLIAGIKIINNSNWIYEITFKNSLEGIISNIVKSYD